MSHSTMESAPEPTSQAEAEEALSGRPMLLNYRPGWPGSLLGVGGDDGRFGNLWAHLHDIERMVHHPDVKIPYEYYKAGISDVQLRVKARKESEAQEAYDILSKCWQSYLDTLQKSYDYGWCGYEVCYGLRKGYLEFEGVYDAHPLDCYALTRNGRYCGFRLKPMTGMGGITGLPSAGTMDLWGPSKWPAKGLWLTHNRRWERYYGLSQLSGAWRPWRRLACKDGAEDVIDGGVYRFAYQGPTVYFPPEDFKKKDGGEFDYDSARNEARAMGEMAKAGFSSAIPSNVRPDGSKRWYMEWPSHVLDVGPLLEYERALQAQISRGVGVPPELFEASETGSGWSGRKVPLLGFYVGQRKNARSLVRQLVRQVVEPILRWNHGDDAWVEVEVEVKLPDALTNDPFGMQQMAASQGGAAAGANVPVSANIPAPGNEEAEMGYWEANDPYLDEAELDLLLAEYDGDAELSALDDDGFDELTLPDDFQDYLDEAEMSLLFAEYDGVAELAYSEEEEFDLLTAE